jgi:hypothetical protein
MVHTYLFRVKVVVDDSNRNAPDLSDLKANLVSNVMGIDAAEYGIKHVECEAEEVNTIARK